MKLLSVRSVLYISFSRVELGNDVARSARSLVGRNSVPGAERGLAAENDADARDEFQGLGFKKIDRDTDVVESNVSGTGTRESGTRLLFHLLSDKSSLG